MASVTQAEFARLKGVSRKTVTGWKQQGRLVMAGDLVDVDASQALLLGASSARSSGKRASVTPAVTHPPEVTRVTRFEPQPHGGALKREQREEDDDPVELIDSDQFLAEVMSGKVHKLVHSERVKEGALAAKQVIAARLAAGQVVELQVAETVLFNAARAARDSWLNWPSRVGPLIAADLNLPADRVTEVLTTHVQSHLAELGEPEADFRPDAD